jgi:hypothetical protein
MKRDESGGLSHRMSAPKAPPGDANVLLTLGQIDLNALFRLNSIIETSFYQAFSQNSISSRLLRGMTAQVVAQAIFIH